MKLNFLRFLTEKAGEKPNFSRIKSNLNKCIEAQKLIYRGSETSEGFGEKEKRENRKSLTNSNIALNFTSVYVSHLPNRKKSYFGTNSPSNASEFGDIFVLIPNDDVKAFAIISNDFNLTHNAVLNQIKEGLTLNNFGFSFTAAIQAVCNHLKINNSKLPFKELNDAITKINFESEGVSETDFNKFDDLFKTVFSASELKDLDSWDTKMAEFVWEVVTSKYDGSFKNFMKAVIRAATKDIKVLSFEEMLDSFGDETLEIWFEGGCSYFSLDWLNKQYQRIYNYDEADIVNDAYDDEDINLAIIEVLKSFL